MAKLGRYLQKIFGVNAVTGAVGVGQVSQFGSFAAASPTTESPVDANVIAIQSLSQWQSGWFSAISGGNCPVMEDFNAVDFIFSRQLAEIFQDGIPPWEVNTTYYLGCFVQATDGSGTLYTSRTNSNTGNAYTNPNFWIPYKGNKALNPQVTPTLATRAASNYTAGSTTQIDFSEICFSPELALFCAVGNSGANSASTSPDGITWTSRTTPNQNWTGICWSPELHLFVATANLPGAPGGIMTSPDGTTWTGQTSASSKNWTSVCWSPELGLLVAVGFSSGLMTSTNGTAWTSRTVSAADDYSSVRWSPSLLLFVAVGFSNGKVMTSPDGITWTTQTAPVHAWFNLCWSGDLGMFVCTNGDFTTSSIMYSYDAITWTNSPIANLPTLGRVDWSPQLGVFVAVAQEQTHGIQISVDGINWVAHAATSNNVWNAIAWGNSVGRFAILPQDASSLTMYSKYVKKFIAN